MNTLSAITVTNITELVTVSSPRGRSANIRDRACWGLSFCMDGQITYTHKGKHVVSDSIHAILLPRGESYTLYGDKSGLFPVINFDCLNFVCDTVVALPIQNPEGYLRDYEQMKALSLFEGNRAQVMGIFYHMLHRLSSQSASCRILMPAIQYLENNYQDPGLTNAILASRCNISEIYFRKLFADQYNTTPKQYILDIRIGKAKQLLADGTLKISAVSEACGFSNPYHFCRAFKQRTGLTPSQYMQQNRLLFTDKP